LKHDSGFITFSSTSRHIFYKTHQIHGNDFCCRVASQQHRHLEHRHSAAAQLKVMPVRASLQHTRPGQSTLLCRDVAAAAEPSANPTLRAQCATQQQSVKINSDLLHSHPDVNCEGFHCFDSDQISRVAAAY
jgi:hypothetical protein